MKQGNKNAPDVSGMPIGEIQKLVNSLHAAQSKLPPIKPAKTGEWLWRVGATYLIRTVSYHYTGVFVGFNGPNNSEVVLKDAAWIADTGRFMQAVQDGALGEVEPYPSDALIGVNRTAISDYCEVKWPTPRSQK